MGKGRAGRGGYVRYGDGEDEHGRTNTSRAKWSVPVHVPVPLTVLIVPAVPAAQGQINLQLQDVPPGDDYFLIFINATHGVLHTTSSRFTILAPSASPSGTVPSPAGGVPTVTVSGSPNPTAQFATTFPAIASSAGQMTLPPVHMSQLLLTFLGVFFGAAWTLALGS